MTVSTHAPIPPDEYGEPGGTLDLLPPDEYDVTQLTSPRDPNTDYTALLDDLLGPLGLPTGRLILRDGLQVFRGVRTLTRWLAVDYFVHGDPAQGQPKVLLNHEAGRCDPDHENAAEPALDRWFVPYEQPLPAWLVPLTPEIVAAQDAVHAAENALNDARLQAIRDLATADQQLAAAITAAQQPEEPADG